MNSTNLGIFLQKYSNNATPLKLFCREFSIKLKGLKVIYQNRFAALI